MFSKVTVHKAVKIRDRGVEDYGCSLDWDVHAGNAVGGTVLFLRYPDPVIADIPVVLRETTLTISDSIETCPPVETEIVRVVSCSTA